MYSVMIFMFCVIYIILMAITQVDYISPFSIIIAGVLSYYVSPYIIRWFVSNDKRVYDNWF